jgi:hypothetical protein
MFNRPGATANRRPTGLALDETRQPIELFVIDVGNTKLAHYRRIACNL